MSSDYGTETQSKGRRRGNNQVRFLTDNVHDCPHYPSNKVVKIRYALFDSDILEKLLLYISD